MRGCEGGKVVDFLAVVLHQRLRGREVSTSTMQPYRYDEQEKEISFEVKEPCPSPRRSEG
jgi:hypothetical protein